MTVFEILGAVSAAITIFSAGVAVGKYIASKDRKKTASSLRTVAIFFFTSKSG